MEKSVVWYTKALNHRKITLSHGLDYLAAVVKRQLEQCYFGIIYICYSYFELAFTLYFQL